MTLQERIDNYARTSGMPQSMFVMTHDAKGKLLPAESQVVVGMWVMGNDYRVKSGYYGGYPAGYLKRVACLFPEHDEMTTLHLFSGRVDTNLVPGVTVDANPDLNPTYVDDAETLEKVPLENFRLVLADPPYSTEDCEHYGTPMVNRNRVLLALTRLPPGAFVVWLDQVLPMYRKGDWRVVARIGMSKSSNHRFRVVTIFERKDDGSFGL